MAEKLGVTRSTYRNWEESTEPDLATIRTIAAALEVPAYTLLKGIIEYSNIPENEKSGASRQPDPQLLTLVKKQVEALQVNLQRLTESIPELPDPGRHKAAEGTRTEGADKKAKSGKR